MTTHFLVNSPVEHDTSVIMWEMYFIDMSAYALETCLRDWASCLARYEQHAQNFNGLPMDRYLCLDVILLDDCSVEQDAICRFLNGRK